MNSLKTLSDNELIGRLRQLVLKERNTTLSILLHLAEVERRQLYLAKACSTLTEYCISELGYGETTASRRARVARVINRVPEVLDLMKQDKLTFSAVVQVASVLNPQNKKQLLPRLVGQSRSQIERILAEYVSPRKVPDQAKPTVVVKQVPVEGAPAGASSKNAGGAQPLEVGQISRHRDGENDPVFKEVYEKMYEIRFAGDEELMELMRWMKAHLSHRFPKGASYLEIFKYAMQYVRDREDLSKKRTRRQKSKSNPKSRHIPTATKKLVLKRDKGRCSFVGSNGKRCDSDYSLQFDHHPIPYARGGPSTASNLRLLCAKHNRYTAEKTYGEHYTKQCVAERKKPGVIKEARAAYFARAPGSRRRVDWLCTAPGTYATGTVHGERHVTKRLWLRE